MRSDIGQARALLCGKCNKAMQAKLQVPTDCEAVKGDPFKLLEAIKEHSQSATKKMST